MRPLIDRPLRDLPPPDAAVLDEARRAQKTPAEHARLMAGIPALHALEQRAPARPVPAPERLTVAAFNAERLKYGPAARALLEGAGAQVALLTEVDVGMARSGNTHTVRDLTRTSGEGYVYGVEFVELGLGDPEETSRHWRESNAESFHGNAIVTGLALTDAHVIPLEEGGSWFPGRDGVQHRIGGRIAVAARVEEARAPLWFVSVHLESKSDAADRAAQMRELLKALDRLAPRAAVVMGGDFNTKALPFADEERQGMLQNPERWEPLFGDARAAGFSWADANLPLPTRRKGPSGQRDWPFRKLDWILTRGVRSQNPRVIPAVDASGEPISDHEMIAVDVIV